VGDRSGLHHWLRGQRNFDLWVTYYGSRPGRFQDMADYYNARQGSKYQNLRYAYRRWGHLIARYSAGAGHGRRHRRLGFSDLPIVRATPASRSFSPRGKISWPVTRVNRRNELRFTNFVEMTCPLFR